MLTKSDHNDFIFDSEYNCTCITFFFSFTQELKEGEGNIHTGQTIKYIIINNYSMSVRWI